ncbi:MAG: hypothetical protein Q9209_001918 [Squamulea sp. 1 TL-2023]
MLPNMASTIHRATASSSSTADPLGGVKCLPIGLDDVTLQEIPYNGDIHKLRDEFDAELEKKCRARDKRIRSFPTWSSPIASPADTKVRFKYRAHGHYLQFLSLFLTGDRQVDIDFSRRHALVLFLLNSLEESHKKYARSKVPEELNILQMISWDELELHNWQAFIRAPYLKLGVLPYARDEDGQVYQFLHFVNRIRQLAVHRTSTYRWNFDTREIKGAAVCAQSLGDDALLQKIELVISVLYADAGGDLGYNVNEEQRNRAYDLLWPTDRQPETTHQLLDKIQNLAERSSYNFCKERLPQELLGFGCTAAEHFELSQWRQIIMRKWYTRSWIRTEDDYFCELDPKLQRADVTGLRNPATHRHRFELHPLGFEFDDTPRLKAYTATAKAYVRALGDDKTAIEIERLEGEVFPLLKAKYDQGLLDSNWCDEQDLDRIDRLISQRISQWDSLHSVFFRDMDVNINPIMGVYGSASMRMHYLQTRLRSNGASPGSSEETSAPTSIQSTAERIADCKPWASYTDKPGWFLEDTALPSSQQDSSLSAESTSSNNKKQEDYPGPEPEDSETTNRSNRGNEIAEGDADGQKTAVDDWKDNENDTATREQLSEADDNEGYDSSNDHEQSSNDGWAEADLAHMAKGSAADLQIAIGDWGGEANNTTTSSRSPVAKDMDRSANSSLSRNLDEEESDISSANIGQVEEYNDTDGTTPSPDRNTGNRGVDGHITLSGKPVQEETDAIEVRLSATSIEDDVP